MTNLDLTFITNQKDETLNWFYPCHIISHTAFMDNVPESFSPYSIDTLYEALTMVANSNLFDETITKSIIETRDCLMLYTKDEESLKMLNKKLSMLRMEEAIFERITKYKKRMGSRS